MSLEYTPEKPWRDAIPQAIHHHACPSCSRIWEHGDSLDRLCDRPKIYLCDDCWREVTE